MKQGEQVDFQGYKIQFAGFNKSPEHPNYDAEEGDIAVGALLSVQSPDGQSYMAQPVFFIRGNLPYNLKDEIAAEGLHTRFVKLDPQNESAIIQVAKTDLPFAVPFDLATDSFSSNWIVLQAIEFPGINLFWLGSILMMLGLLWSMWIRARSKISAA